MVLGSYHKLLCNLVTLTKKDRNPMDRTILVEKRSVYGNTLIYPLNYQEEIKALTGQKTLSEAHIGALSRLGFNFTERPLSVFKSAN